MKTPLLEVQDLHVDLGGHPVLSGVNLSMDPGGYLSIVGPNGAGKTTLVRCLAGLLAPGSGQILLDGRPLQDLSSRERARRLAYVPQAIGGVPPFSVETFVLMGRYPHLSPFTSPRAEDHEAVRAALQRTDTTHLARRAMDQLSGGERQMVFLAAAIAQQADVLLLDEPAAFLDYRHQLQVMGTLEKLNTERGVTIVTVSHDINMAARRSKRILALRRGVCLVEGSPREILASESLQAIYDAPFRMVPDAPWLPLALPEERPS